MCHIKNTIICEIRKYDLPPPQKKKKKLKNVKRKFITSKFQFKISHMSYLIGFVMYL